MSEQRRAKLRDILVPARRMYFGLRDELLLSLVVILALFIQLLVLNEFRPVGIPANLVSLLVIWLALSGFWRAAWLAGLFSTLVMDAFSLAGLGLSGFSLLAAAYFVYRVRGVFGSGSLNRFLCLATGLMVNQLLYFFCLFLAGELYLTPGVFVWRVLLQGTIMDLLLATVLFFLAVKLVRVGGELA